MSKVLVLALFLMTIPDQLRAQPGDDALAERIHAWLEGSTSKGYSGAVLLAEDGDIVMARGYGFADREKGLPVDSRTIFNIGALTREFTIAGILKLVELDRLKLDATLADILAGVPADKRGITVEHLLTHHSGISGQSGGYRYDYVSREQFLAQLFREPLVSEPGSRQEFSNTGYILLAALIEAVSGQSYEDFLREWLLRPAGMTRTGYILPDWRPDDVAHGYFFDIASERWVDWGTTLDQFGPEGVSWYGIGKGELHSTVHDLHAWRQALAQGRLLAPARAMQLEDFLHPGQPDSTSYHEDGANGHYQAELIQQDADGLLIVSLANMGRAIPVGAHLARMASEPAWEPPPFPGDPYELLVEFMATHSPEDVDQLPSWFAVRQGHALDDPALLNPMGIMRMNRGDHAWAVALLALNVELFPDDGNFWDSLGEAYLANGQETLAIASFREALRRAPSDSCVWCLNASFRLSTLGG